MPKHMMTTNALPFRIQLLADKSVVLVEEPSHESEIFMPQLFQGRIALENVVYSRQRRLRESETHLGERHHFKHPQYGGQRLAGSQQKLTTATVGLAPLALFENSQMLLPHHQQKLFELPSYALKLILNGNVVLVECNGYESEIFLPHIRSHCIAMKRVTANELVQLRNGRKPSSHNLCSIYTPGGFSGCIAAHALNQVNRVMVHPKQLLHNNNAKSSNANAKEPVLKTPKKVRHYNRRRRVNQNQNQIQVKQSGAGDQRISSKCPSTKCCLTQNNNE